MNGQAWNVLYFAADDDDDDDDDEDRHKQRKPDTLDGHLRKTRLSSCCLVCLFHCLSDKKCTLYVIRETGIVHSSIRFG